MRAGRGGQRGWGRAGGPPGALCGPCVRRWGEESLPLLCTACSLSSASRTLSLGCSPAAGLSSLWRSVTSQGRERKKKNRRPNSSTAKL